MNNQNFSQFSSGTNIETLGCDEFEETNETMKLPYVNVI